jgi:hypothetical protein
MPTTRASTQSTSSKPLKSDVEYLNSLVAAVPDTDTDSDSPEPEGDDSGSGNTCAPSGNDSDYSEADDDDSDNDFVPRASSAAASRSSKIGRSKIKRCDRCRWLTRIGQESACDEKGAVKGEKCDTCTAAGPQATCKVSKHGRKQLQREFGSVITSANPGIDQSDKAWMKKGK